MVCTASDLQEWKDFPKGLKVLLLDQDSDSASEIRSKLELMDYVGKIILFSSSLVTINVEILIPESENLHLFILFTLSPSLPQLIFW